MTSVPYDGSIPSRAADAARPVHDVSVKRLLKVSASSFNLTRNRTVQRPPPWALACGPLIPAGDSAGAAACRCWRCQGASGPGPVQPWAPAAAPGRRGHRRDSQGLPFKKKKLSRARQAPPGRQATRGAIPKSNATRARPEKAPSGNLRFGLGLFVAACATVKLPI